MSSKERWDRVTRQLAAQPRRRLLVSLTAVPAERRIPLPEAAGPATIDLAPDELLLELRHRHLPMLEDAGYVRWEREPFSAQRGPNFEEVEAVLEILLAGADELPPEMVRGCHSLEERVGRS